MVSVSVCSNVPGFKEPKCIINSNGEELVSEMLNHLEEIQKKVEAVTDERWLDAIQQLEELVKEETATLSENDKAPHPLRDLQSSFYHYLRQLLTFHSTVDATTFNSFVAICCLSLLLWWTLTRTRIHSKSSSKRIATNEVALISSDSSTPHTISLQVCP